MAKAVQKITLSPSRDIPFNKLVLSQSNVRRVKAGVSIEQLAESIAQRTLLQSLSVRAVVDAEGNETGMFEVPAGGSRYRALELLVKQKRMAKTQAVPCVVREGGIAEDDSMAENDERVGLHPLDQFRAFQTLRDLGMSEEDIAARHFVTPAIVKQRLRLASVSPKLHEVYAEDGMTLEQLMAFSVTAITPARSRSGRTSADPAMTSHTRSAACSPRTRYARPTAVRSSSASMPTSRPAVRSCAICSSMTMAAGCRTSPLLDRLVTEKLKAEAETIAAEGWKWISVAVGFPYGHDDGLRELEGKPADITVEEQATIDALKPSMTGSRPNIRMRTNCPTRSTSVSARSKRRCWPSKTEPMVYDPADIVRAGVFVSIDSEGRLSVDRGYVRPEDEAPAADPEIGQGADTSSTGGQRGYGLGARHGHFGRAVSPTEAEEDDEDVTKPLPDRLIIELTAHRTLALRDALAENPAIAFQAVLHNFVLTAFYRFASSGSCLEIGLRTPTFPLKHPG